MRKGTLCQEAARSPFVAPNGMPSDRTPPDGGFVSQSYVSSFVSLSVSIPPFYSVI